MLQVSVAQLAGHASVTDRPERCVSRMEEREDAGRISVSAQEAVETSPGNVGHGEDGKPASALEKREDQSLFNGLDGNNAGPAGALEREDLEGPVSDISTGGDDTPVSVMKDGKNGRAAHGMDKGEDGIADSKEDNGKDERLASDADRGKGAKPDSGGIEGGDARLVSDTDRAEEGGHVSDEDRCEGEQAALMRQEHDTRSAHAMQESVYCAQACYLP